MSLDSARETPQFGTAEYDNTPAGTERCKICGQPVGKQYYRVSEKMSCELCAQKVRAFLAKDTHTIFMRALLFGAFAALGGMILYATAAIVTGLQIGYVSLAVGWIVGKAMVKGSGGVGGRRYQVAALALTYAAVSIAFVPIAIQQAVKSRSLGSRRAAQTAPTATPRTAAGDVGPGVTAPDRPDAPAQASAPTAKKSANSGAALLIGLVTLLGVGLVSPFLALASPFSGMIGLLILSIGMRIAWRITAGVQVAIFGPFAVTPPSPST